MATSPLSPWPEDLFDFGFIPGIGDQLRDLANEAEREDWEYLHTHSEYPFPVLYNYIRFTYKRVAIENKVALATDGQFSCFNTGLVTYNQEPIFASFEANRKEGAQPWFFKGWFRRGEWELTKFSELPDLAHYFDDPTCLVLDNRKDFRVNLEHILNETPRERFPETVTGMTDYAIQNILRGAIDSAKERVRRSYKTAVPQYYRGQVQLLLPLCLSDARQADLALVVERHTTFYRAATCLTLDMAYNNARQLARPDRDWLHP